MSFIDYRDFPLITPLVEYLKVHSGALAAEAIQGIERFSPSPERYIMDDVRLFILPAIWQRKRIDQAGLEPGDYREWRPSCSPQRLADSTITLAALCDHPAVVTAYYSMSMPGCEIVPHTDNESAIGAVYRLHVGLACPEGDCALEVAGERREWLEGQAFMFDSARVTHAAWNRTERPRLILILDFDRAMLEESRKAGLLSA